MNVPHFMIDLLSLGVQVTKTEMVTPTFEGFLSDVSILVDEAVQNRINNHKRLKTA